MGAIRSKPTVDYSEEDFSFHISTNLESAFHLSQLAHPLLKASGCGNIVFMSSIAGVVSASVGSIYSATKGFILIIEYCHQENRNTSLFETFSRAFLFFFFLQ